MHKLQEGGGLIGVGPHMEKVVLWEEGLAQKLLDLLVSVSLSSDEVKWVWHRHPDGVLSDFDTFTFALQYDI